MSVRRMKVGVEGQRSGLKLGRQDLLWEGLLHGVEFTRRGE